MDGGRTGVSIKEPLRTPIQLPPKNNTKPHNTKKNIKYQNTKKSIKQKTHQKNRKTQNRQNSNKNVVQTVPIFSANCAGCENKTQSLIDNINHIGAGIITLQETHLKQKGKLNKKLGVFELFEAIRKKQKLEPNPH